jgi:hypothetical protein
MGQSRLFRNLVGDRKICFVVPAPDPDLRERGASSTSLAHRSLSTAGHGTGSPSCRRMPPLAVCMANFFRDTPHCPDRAEASPRLHLMRVFSAARRRRGSWTAARHPPALRRNRSFMRTENSTDAHQVVRAAGTVALRKAAGALLPSAEEDIRDEPLRAADGCRSPAPARGRCAALEEAARGRKAVPAGARTALRSPDQRRELHRRVITTRVR